MTAGETLSPKIPNAKYSDQETARRNVLGYMQYGMTNDIFDALENYTNDNYISYMNNPEIRQHFSLTNYPVIYPWSQEQIDNVTFS